MKYPGRARPFFASRLTTDASGVEEKVAGEGRRWGSSGASSGGGGGEKTGERVGKEKTADESVSRSRWIKVN